MSGLSIGGAYAAIGLIDVNPIGGQHVQVEQCAGLTSSHR